MKLHRTFHKNKGIYKRRFRLYAWFYSLRLQAWPEAGEPNVGNE